MITVRFLKVNVPQVAKFWGFSISWVYRNWPQLHGYKIGSRIRFDAVDQQKLKANYKRDYKKQLTIISAFDNLSAKGGNKLASKSQARLIRGFGKPYQRKPGGSWYIGFYKNGKRIQKVIPYAQTEEEAYYALNQERIKLFDEKYGIERRSRTIGFTAFSEIFIRDYAMTAKRSWKTDASRMKVLNEFFMNKELREITPLTVERFRKSRLKSGNTKSTTNRYLALLKVMFTTAIQENYTEENPASRVKFYSEKDTMRTRVLEEGEEEEKLMEASSDALRPILVVALHTGMRKGEILNLKWSQVDLKARIIRVEKTKSGKVRHIPINDAVFNELNRLRKMDGQSPFVFFNPETMKPYIDVKKGFGGVCRRARISGLRFHDLRHTFATRLISTGADIETVRDLLGHHSIIVTQRYTHSNSERKKKAVGLLSTGRLGDNTVTKEIESELIS